MCVNWERERLERRDREYRQLEAELREKGFVYDSCSGCGRAYLGTYDRY